MKNLINQKFNAYRKRLLNYTPPTITDIKNIRRMYNLSQRSFAEMLDINVRTLQDYELGRRTPSQTAAALFHFAKIEVKTFLKYIYKDSRPFHK